MKRHHRFSAEHFEVVEWMGKRIGVHMAVYSPAYRNRRIPVPPPRPLEDEAARELRAAVEGTAAPEFKSSTADLPSRWLRQ